MFKKERKYPYHLLPVVPIENWTPKPGFLERIPVIWFHRAVSNALCLRGYYHFILTRTSSLA